MISVHVLHNNHQTS